MALFALLTISGCSKVAGSKSPNPGKPPACAYVAKLDTIADTVAKANVQDPDAFDKTLQTAVQDYVANVRELRANAPADLSTSLTQVEADVQQFRFDAAVTDRAPLDAYAARLCGRVAPSSTASTSPPTTGFSPNPTTTVPTGPTTTTTPSDG